MKTIKRKIRGWIEIVEMNLIPNYELAITGFGKKREKHPWRHNTFIFKLYKWYHIAQSISIFPMRLKKN